VRLSWCLISFNKVNLKFSLFLVSYRHKRTKFIAGSTFYHPQRTCGAGRVLERSTHDSGTITKNLLKLK
jgi:hypothetical protein